MERLTQRNEDGTVRCPMPEGYEPPCHVVTWEAVDRLAAYEDTDLEPDKLKQLVDAIRKHEVVFLTKDRFLEKMLIKVDGEWADFIIAEVQDFLRAKKEGRLMVLPCKVGDTVWIIEEDGIYRVRVQGISASVSGKDCILRFGGYPSRSAWGSEVGKTVFLTQEEAEAAYKKGGKP